MYSIAQSKDIAFEVKLGMYTLVFDGNQQCVCFGNEAVFKFVYSGLDASVTSAKETVP